MYVILYIYTIVHSFDYVSMKLTAARPNLEIPVYTRAFPTRRYSLVSFHMPLASNHITDIILLIF